jgi:hypothetical protein
MGRSGWLYLLAVAVSLILASCAQPLVSDGTMVDQTGSHVDVNVGKEYSIDHPTFFCNGPPGPFSNSLLGAQPCQTLKSGRFRISARTHGSIVDGYQVEVEDKGPAWISESSLLGLVFEKSHDRRIATAKAECDKRGGVTIGMTRAQVYASCWGKPLRVNKTIGSYGTHEQLIYGGSNYLYLENGILRSIQTSSR